MAGVDAFGTIWAMGNGDGPPETFTAVADVTNIDVLNVKVDDIDMTTHDSTEGWREFHPGLKDAGELSMDVNYDPSVHGTLWSAVGTTKNHKITLTDTGAATVEFAAFISAIKAQAPYDDKLSATVTLRLSGKPTITP